MQLFIDTGNIEHIKEISSWGILSGVTTNPTLSAKEGKNFRSLIAEITSIVKGPVSAEAVSLDRKGIVEEARELVSIAENVVVKVPIIPEGLTAIKILSDEGIKTNATLAFSVNQALLAANAGATFISPFIGRLDDIGNDGISILADIVSIYRLYNIETKVISASIRHPQHVIDSARVGADIATIPYDVFQKMVKHPLTEIGLKNFLADWEKIKNL